MIHGISGKSGGGKSYEAVVTHIIPIVTKERRLVVTNLPINVDRFCAIFGEYCRELIIVVDGEFHNYGGERPFSKVEHFKQYRDWKNEKGQRCYFFIDECHLAMPKGKSDQQLVEFMSMARHSGYDIMLISQNFRKVDIDIRDNIVNHYRAIKKSIIGHDDKYTLKVHDGWASSNASVVATHDRIYEKKYFDFYVSHTDSDSAVEEAASNDIEKWYKHWTIKASVFMFILAFFIVSKQLSKSDDVKVVDDKPVESIDSSVSASSSSGVRTERVPALPEPELPKSEGQMQYEKMLEASKTYHPFYKVKMSISGSAEYNDGGRRVVMHYISASQNGQHVFTLKSSDLMLAGYDIRILTSCAISIKYFDYQDFLTCDAPTQSVTLAGDNLAKATN